MITQSSGTAGALMHVQCYLPRSEHRSSLARLVGLCHWAALGCASLVVCNGLQALPHPTSVRAGVV